MEVARFHSFGQETLDWYWEHGLLRSGKYALSTGEWTNTFYQVLKNLGSLREALAETQPAVAIWGPSQTGKSTLVSKYIDAKVQITGNIEEDGKGSALHWEGGTPAFFLFPYDNKELFQDGSLVLNPFNSGLDASACLSRFVLGSRDGDSGHFHVRDPQYPVEIRLVTQAELWQSIARGYDSQCLGPKPAAGALDSSGRPPPRYPTVWTPEKFRQTLQQFQQRPARGQEQPVREAFEHLHDFCDLVEDLIFAELTRFRQLQSGEHSWSSLRKELLSDASDGQRNALLYDFDLAEQFTSTILWDNYQILTDYYRNMRAMQQDFAQRWGGKPIFCSLEVAALFLDMETYKNFLQPAPASAGPGDERARKILRTHATIPAIATEDRGDCVIWGADAALGDRLIDTPESFGMLQGLVWEMVVPLNPDHLEETHFKRFLSRAQLLDFPGVERGGKDSDADKIDLDVMSQLRQSGKILPGASDPEEYDASAPYQFFTKILKRGKTSSIVCTYAKRLTIDAFNIFQDLDRDKPNGGELITGIHTWWKFSAPDYYRNPKGQSPLPLNFVLLWWATLFNEGHTMQNLQKKYGVLGPIADPEIATTFALNYYSIYRGKVLPEKLDEMPAKVQSLQAEPAWRKQFGNDVSRKAFAAMVEDKTTGGTEFFFETLARQLDTGSAGEGEGSRRLQLLQEKERVALSAMTELMNRHELFPDPQPRDLRREHLEAFRQSVLAQIAGKNEAELKRVNHMLREFLNVRSADLPAVPLDPLDIHSEAIRTQIETWVSAQMDRLGNGAGQLDLSLLGVPGREEAYQFLNALAQSLEPELNDIASWLRRLVQYLRAAGDLTTDPRRYLALRLGNALVYGPAGPRVTDQDEDMLQPSEEDEDETPHRELKGKECRYYRYFLRPVLDDEGYLSYLAQRSIRPVTRPEQPGDDAILALAEAHDMPFTPKLPSETT